MTRAALYILAAVAGFALCIAVWLILTAPARERAKANQAAASRIVAEGRVAAGRDAVAVVTANAAHGQEIDRQTQENRDAILNAPGADVQLDPGLDAALRRSVCKRASVREPSCQSVQHARP